MNFKEIYIFKMKKKIKNKNQLHKNAITKFK